MDWFPLAVGAVAAVGAAACIAMAVRRSRPALARVAFGLLALPLSAWAYNGLGIAFGLSGH